VDSESSVDTDVADAADEEGRSPGVVLAESGSSICDGGAGCTGFESIVVRGLSAGLLNLPPDLGLCVFRNVFRAVGEVADNVSNRRLVEPFPKTGLTSEVLRLSFGRFDGDGPSNGTLC